MTARPGRHFFERFVPARASTQTWMILTFVFFVGIAVVAVGLYIAFVLRSEVQVAFRQTLVEQTLQIATLVEEVPDDSSRAALARDFSRFGGLHVTVLAPNRLIADVHVGEPARTDIPSPGDAVFPENGDVLLEEYVVDGVRLYYASMVRHDSGLIVRVGQPRPPLFRLIQRIQYTLAAAMLMALLLAVFGSWIAAERVTEPLVTIRNSARSISEGQLDREILVDSRASEFQDLAKSLNRMSDTFKEKIQELERLAALQNEFIGNVSHEVRNPIFAVGGYLEALGSSSLSDDQRRFYAEKGLMNLERLNNLFSDLIEIARLEYREDLIKPSIFNLQDLLKDVAEVVQAKAEAKGLELHVDNPEWFVRADRARLRQVLINLIDNAIAYSDEGSVRCRCRRHLDKVRIEVVDTGRGIPEEHLEKVFERFHRVDPDRSRKSGGTGLGLSIVRQILASHGESIHVESTVGRGTRFWFEIPFASESPDA